MRLGKDELDRGLKSYRAAGPPDLDAVAEEFGFNDAEHLYAALGNGDLSVGKVISRIAPLKPMRRAIRPQDRRDIRIQGMKNLMIQFGKCCGPIPGDEIIGLVTRGRGITVHRTDCYNIGRISAEPNRLLAVEWEQAGRNGLYRSATHPQLGPQVLARGHLGGDQHRRLQHPRIHYPHRYR